MVLVCVNMQRAIVNDRPVIKKNYIKEIRKFGPQQRHCLMQAWSTVCHKTICHSKEVFMHRVRVKVRVPAESLL